MCGSTRSGYSREYHTRHFTDGKGNYTTLHEDTDAEYFFVYNDSGTQATSWLDPDKDGTIPEQIAKRGLKEHGSSKEAREAADQEGRGGDEEEGGDTEELVEEEAVEAEQERVAV